MPGYGRRLAGIGVPRSTLAEIIDTLNREINAAIADAKIKTRLAEFMACQCDDARGLWKAVVEETEKWVGIKFAGKAPE